MSQERQGPEEPRIEGRAPWPQPFSFGGVAAYSRRPRRWLWITLFFVQLVCVRTFFSAVDGTLLSPVGAAVHALDEGGVLRAGRLEWGFKEARTIASGSVVSIVAVPDGGDAPDAIDRSSQFQFELRSEGLRIVSLFGVLRVPWPRGDVLSLRESDAVPWWESRLPMIKASIVIASFLLFPFVWVVLGVLYAIPVRLLAWLSDRQTTFRGCCRIGIASLMPGALLMSLLLQLHTSGRLSFIGLLIGASVHIPLAWVYLVGAAFKLPKESKSVISPSPSPFDPAVRVGTVSEASPASNPFQPASPSDGSVRSSAERGGKNPFE